MAKHIYTYTNPSSERDLKTTCESLRNDGIIAYPSDVNWAFACDSKSNKAMQKILQLKPSHRKDQPFSLLCSDLSMVADYAHIDAFAYRILRKILPGPYTVILDRSKNLPKQIKDKRKKVGIRIPGSDLMLDLIRSFGGPLATTSLPQESSDNLIEYGYQVDQRFGHSLDIILDLGQALPQNETTILDFSEGEAKLVRLGLGPVDFL